MSIPHEYEGPHCECQEVLVAARLHIHKLEARCERYKVALEKIKSVTQFDHPTSQIISSEEYEGAWLDCIDIAEEALEAEGKGGR
jgi:hypothetical protein